jgi:hypothetical protein
MDVDQSIREFGLVPPDGALPRIRSLLAGEAELERAGRGGARTEDLALLCCVQLFSRGLFEDVLRIWDAKQSGFDLSCYLGVQLLCGAGLAETKAFLGRQTSSEAAEALAYISHCEGTRDFDDFTPTSHLDQWRQYFGVAASEAR